MDKLPADSNSRLFDHSRLASLPSSHGWGFPVIGEVVSAVALGLIQIMALVFTLAGVVLAAQS